MTMAEMARMDSTFVSTAQAAEVLECDRNHISVMAASEEGRAALGFPVIRIGNRTKIPRAPFLRYLGWEGRIEGAVES